MALKSSATYTKTPSYSMTKPLCPHASKCWKGGGSYKCAYNPPFCEKPLIPKEKTKGKKNGQNKAV